MRIRHSILPGLALTAVLSLVAGGASAALFGCSCTLTGAQEVPPTGSPALGSGSFVYDDATDAVSYTILYSGLSAGLTASHIHGPAAPGISAAILFPLNPVTGTTSGTMTGSWPALGAANVTSLANGLLYVNIHTGNFPGGEIRGQILPDQATPTQGTTWGRTKGLYR